jgi:hypothetical protein
MLIKEIIAIYTENLTKPIIQSTGLLIIKADGTNIYHSVLNG